MYKGLSSTIVTITFSMAVALMTRGPLTAYSIFLMQGFMLSRVTVAGAAIFTEVDVMLRDDDKTFCLKPSIL